MSQRGHAEPSDFYHCLHDAAGQEDRNRETAARELSVAQADLQRCMSVLSAIQDLMYVLSVSSVVLEDVHQLCHACAEDSEAFTSTLGVFSGRARAAQKRDARARR